jgi:hypothetical protein
LVALIGWVSWFAFRAWSMRDLWSNVAIIHDPRRPLEDRLTAARGVSRDPRVDPRQIWDMLIQDGLPERVRSVLGTGLPEDLVRAEPGVVLGAVASRQDWPASLRLALLLKAAHAVRADGAWPVGPLRDLQVSDDPAIAMLASFVQAACFRDSAARARLERRAGDPTSGEFARRLSWALEANDEHRRDELERAQSWLEANHPAFHDPS